MLTKLKFSQLKTTQYTTSKLSNLTQKKKYAKTNKKEAPKDPSGEVKSTVSEAAKFLAKNEATFSKYISLYSTGLVYTSLEDAVTQLYGNASAKDIEQRFHDQYTSLRQEALARDFDSEYFRLNPRQAALVNEYVSKDSALRKELEKKYGEKFLSPWKYNLTNDLLAGAQPPIRVAITGAAGAIGYSLAYRIASGNVFGPNTPVELHLLELTSALGALEGVVMELNDCAFPLLKNVLATDKAEAAFEGVDYALLVGAKPRGPGMERSDLLQQNAQIFKTQGQALHKVAKGANTRVIVVGNPANTNCLIAQTHAKSIPVENFTAMTRLDHNRGLAQLANKLKVHTTDIKNFAIWGNHSATQFPDVSHATVKGKRVIDLVEKEWLVNDFIPVVQQRGAAIIKARGASSAASAAAACLDGVRDWYEGTFGEWTSAAVYSKGEYGITQGLFYSYPLIFADKQWNVVKDLPIDEFARERMDKTHKELLEERDAVSKLL